MGYMRDRTGVRLDTLGVADLEPAVVHAADGKYLAPLPGRLYNIAEQNAVAFTQDNVTTDNGVQYAIWSDSNQHPIVGKRTLPFGDWTTFDLSTVSGNPLASPTVNDGHNNYVIAVDSAGYIHVSGNMHNNPLRYIRSTNPGDITTWTTPSGMVGAQENQATYPQFVRAASGELLFFYRDGGSGGGDEYINVFNPTTLTWSRRAQLFKGTAPVNPDENAYLNHIAVSDDGTIHVFFIWRTTDDPASTHDIGYVKSTDHGVTWRDAAGTVKTLPITPSTAPVVVAGNNKAINQNGADVDSDGHPHSLWWLQLTPNVTQLVHVWHDGSAWHQDVVDNLAWNVSTLNLARPSVLCYGRRTFAIYLRESGTTKRRVLRCKDITPTSYGLRALPEFPLFEGDLLGYEATFDTRAARERSELYMLITPTKSSTYTTVPAHILTMDLADLSRRSDVDTIARTSSWWVGAENFIAAIGTPALSVPSSTPAWALDPSTIEGVYGAPTLPKEWRTFDVDVWWFNTAAFVASSVVWQFRYAWIGSGVDVNSGEALGADTISATAAQNILKVATVATGIVVPADDVVLRATVRRQATNASDSVAGDAQFAGLMLRRTS